MQSREGSTAAGLTPPPQQFPLYLSYIKLPQYLGGDPFACCEAFQEEALKQPRPKRPLMELKVWTFSSGGKFVLVAVEEVWEAAAAPSRTPAAPPTPPPKAAQSDPPQNSCFCDGLVLR